MFYSLDTNRGQLLIIYCNVRRGGGRYSLRHNSRKEVELRIVKMRLKTHLSDHRAV